MVHRPGILDGPMASPAVPDLRRVGRADRPVAGRAERGDRPAAADLLAPRPVAAARPVQQTSGLGAALWVTS